MKSKKYLVTGGTGFIGAALVQRLVKDGYSVRVLDNNFRGAKESLDPVLDKIEFVEADIRDPDKVDSACKGVDGVIHLAFINGTKYFYSMPELVLDVGVKGIVNVIDGCKKAGVKELILASSSEVYQTPPYVPTDELVPLSVPDPTNPRYSYGAGKIISELLTINNGRKFFERAVIFRPHNVYGPKMGYEHVIPEFILKMDKLSKKAKEKSIKFPIEGSGEETRAFVFIEDFIDGLMTVIEKGAHLEIYNIGTMNEITIKELAAEIARCFGREIEIVTGEIKEGGTRRRCPDIGKLKKLGYSPKCGLYDGLKATTEWYISEAKNEG